VIFSACIVAAKPTTNPRRLARTRWTGGGQKGAAPGEVPNAFTTEERLRRQFTFEVQGGSHPFKVPGEISERHKINGSSLFSVEAWGWMG
jgi:hypothetical protein